jgi:hypothetical protein
MRSGWGACEGRGRRVEDSRRRRRRIHGFAEGGGHQMQERGREGKKASWRQGEGSWGTRDTQDSFLEAYVEETQYLCAWRTSTFAPGTGTGPVCITWQAPGLCVVNLCYILIARHLHKVLALRLWHPKQCCMLRISSSAVCYACSCACHRATPRTPGNAQDPRSWSIVPTNKLYLLRTALRRRVVAQPPEQSPVCSPRPAKHGLSPTCLPT